MASTELCDHGKAETRGRIKAATLFTALSMWIPFSALAQPLTPPAPPTNLQFDRQSSCPAPDPVPIPNYDVVPAVPRGFAAYATSPTDVRLEWIDDSNNETGFRIERGPTSVGPWQVLATVPAGTTEYSDGGLTPDTLYYYQLFAFNDIGDDLKADFASVRPSDFARTLGVADTTPPEPVSGFFDEELRAHAVSCREVYLVWAAWQDPTPDFPPYMPSGLYAYHVYRDGVLHYRVLRPKSFLVDRVSPGTTHSYFVRAVDAAGNESVPTAEVVVPGISCPPPGCSTDLLCDPENCGACGNSCSGAACVNGKCQPTPLTEIGAPGGIAATSAGLYFKANSALKRINRDGSGLETVVAPVSSAGDLVSDGGTLFYIDKRDGTHSLYSLPVGGDTPQLVWSGGIDAVGLAYNSAHLLIADRGTDYNSYDGAIHIVPKAGGASQELLSGLRYPNVVAANAGNYFWGSWPDHAIYQENYDGSPGLQLVDNELHPNVLHASDSHLYWINQGNLSTTGEVMSLKIDNAVRRRLTYGQAQAWHAAYDDTHVYWLNLGSTDLSGYTDGEVMKMPLQGGIPMVLAKLQSYPVKIEVDEDYVYWMTASPYDLDYLWKVAKGKNLPDPPVCGDSTCDEMEDCANCFVDCGFCDVSCGDGSCQMGLEDCTSCAADCGPCTPVCGDTICGAADGENCVTCDTDCNNQDQVCGNGHCFGNEDSFNCYADCGPAPSCVPPQDCSLLRDPAWAQWEQEVLTLINQLRAAGADCPSTQNDPVGPLTLDTDLERASQLHAWDMTYSNYFSHFSCNGRTHYDRAMDQNTSVTGEVIAVDYDEGPVAVVDGWMASQLHCAVIMKSTSRFVGVGYALHTEPSWVAMFR